MAHVAARLFGTPLLVHEAKLQAILGGIGDRLGLKPMAFDDDDFAAQTVPQQPRRPYAVTPDGVAIVPVVGVLVNRSGQMDANSASLRSYGEIRRDMVMAISDPGVRAIALDVDSPGGECAGCFELAETIRGMRGRKPIVAAANGYAYSAAYALASAADVLFVGRAGGVGSVGVVALHVDQSARDQQQGLAFEYVFAGAKKIDGSSHAPLSEGARSDLNSEVQRCYGLFSSLVAANRSLAESAVRGTEAGCFYGETAISVGLADRVGTLSDAVAEAARRADAAAPGGTTERGRPARAASTSGEHMSTNTDGAAPAAPADQTTVAPAEGNAAQAAAAAGSFNAENAAAIVELCALAGQPQAAAGYIREGKTKGEVSEALLRARAAAQDTTSVSAGHGVVGAAEASRTTNPADPFGWNASIDRVCGKQKGA
ncbi:hypothetical protein BKE38_05110 [Pseudoroseomonas deserti]|uniref:Peptidase S49 domain-containing protein n=2 Tax=Teichococcus deserti TaxID=1817963 RepID=A0A1V2H6F3_9PROT|nr:hypothetical protein BKE38_05110 [Pseudoroseomonas deserti]